MTKPEGRLEDSLQPSLSSGGGRKKSNDRIAGRPDISL